MKTRWNIFLILFFISLLTLQGGQPLKELVAEKYGLDNFSKVKSIDFTFNVKMGNKSVSRKWLWYPKTNAVTFWGKYKDGKELKYTYTRKKISEVKDPKTRWVDARFINDEYWLLFPFHLVWDTNVDVENAGIKKFPLSNEKGKCLIVKFSKNVGYTPGDIFELYIGKDNLIKQWVYRPGGSEKEKYPALWQDNKDFNGITISTMHNDPQGKFKLWFTDVKVDE